MIKSDILPLFHVGNGLYQSAKISLDAIIKICESCNSPYFQIKMMKNNYKEEGDKKPEYVFCIVSKKPRGNEK